MDGQAPRARKRRTLSSIEPLESALLNFEEALVVVSHDEVFLDALGIDGVVDLGATVS